MFKKGLLPITKSRRIVISITTQNERSYSVLTQHTRNFWSFEWDYKTSNSSNQFYLNAFWMHSNFFWIQRQLIDFKIRKIITFWFLHNNIIMLWFVARKGFPHKISRKFVQFIICELLPESDWLFWEWHIKKSLHIRREHLVDFSRRLLGYIEKIIPYSLSIL